MEVVSKATPRKRLLKTWPGLWPELKGLFWLPLLLLPLSKETWEWKNISLGVRRKEEMRWSWDAGGGMGVWGRHGEERDGSAMDFCPLRNRRFCHMLIMFPDSYDFHQLVGQLAKMTSLPLIFFQWIPWIRHQIVLAKLLLVHCVLGVPNSFLKEPQGFGTGPDKMKFTPWSYRSFVFQYSVPSQHTNREQVIPAVNFQLI